MQLPVDEEDDKQVVRVPEALEVRPTLLLSCEINHDTEGCCHDPTCDARASNKVGTEESKEPLSRARPSEQGQFVEVDHVGDNVHDSPNDHGPSRCLVEGQILVKGDDIVQGCPTQKRDEVAANREKNENDIDMENKSGSPGDSW